MGTEGQHWVRCPTDGCAGRIYYWLRDGFARTRRCPVCRRTHQLLVVREGLRLRVVVGRQVREYLG